jgi:large subunit ribosomal protein L6
MSRIGKQPVSIPSGVKVELKGDEFKVQGPKGTLVRKLRTDYVSVAVESDQVVVTRTAESKMNSAMHGLTRSLINNMVTGVAEGFTRELEVIGVGYRAAVKGKNLELSLGFSHPVTHPLPEGVTAKVQGNMIAISGADKEILGNEAAKIRAYRPPEPYKGKGVKYKEERIIRKAGKTAGK